MPERSLSPSLDVPESSPPAGIRLASALGPDAVPEALALLAGSYWNEGLPDETIARAFLASTVWVGAHDDAGALVAMARALSDVSKVAWIYDVVVRPDWRGKGLGQAIMGFLLAHPMVRDVRKVRLSTRDAHGLYAKFGFRNVSEDVLQSEMIWDRS